MPKFNSAYFQTQILKNQIAVDVAVANNTRFNEDVAASLATTVEGTTINAPSGNHLSTVATAINQFIISTNSKLYRSTGAGVNWVAATNTTNYVLDASSNATNANKAYTVTGGDGTLSAITSGRFKSTNNTVLYTCAAGGDVTVVSAGRYFNHASAPTELLNVAYGVTDGTYTTITAVQGQSQLSNTLGYLYYNSTASRWLSANAAHTHVENTAGTYSQNATTNGPTYT